MRRLLAAITLGLALLFVASAGTEPRTAQAHPLGNFTVNRLSLIELRAEGVSLRYVLDLAEIPAFQELKSIDKNGDGLFSEEEKSAYVSRAAPELTRNLDLSVGGKTVALSLARSELSFPEGQGGLNTLRFVLDLSGALPEGWQNGADASYKDGNYADRIGWKQVVVRGGAGVALTDSSASLEDTTAELTAYPVDALKSPPDVRGARFRFAAGESVLAPRPLSTDTPAATTRAPGRSLSHFADSIAAERLTPAFIAISLLAAIAWGAAHALGPGHGKTIVAAYLVGSRGTARHAALLGATVTLTHVSSVITLGLVTLYASRFFAAEDLYLWLSVLSGVTVALMGAYLFASRLRLVMKNRGRPQALTQAHGGVTQSHAEVQSGNRAIWQGGPELAGALSGLPDSPIARLPAPSSRLHAFARANARAHSNVAVEERPSYAAAQTHTHDGHAHSHGDHDHGEHGHSHTVPEGVVGVRALIALGISGGIVPCPTALVVMLAAIALDRIAYGLALIVAFSIGLAGVLVAIGLLVVYASRRLQGEGRIGRLLGSGVAMRWLQAAPIASALVILVVGVVLIGRALSAL